MIDGVATGSVVPTVNTATLPPYYNVGRVPTVQVPTTAEVAIPLVLPIGSNRPNTYLAFGDSITEGNNYPGDPSYRGPLASKLPAAVRPRHRDQRRGRVDQEQPGRVAHRRPAHRGTARLHPHRLRHERLWAERVQQRGQAGHDLLHDREPARHHPVRERLVEPARAGHHPARERRLRLPRPAAARKLGGSGERPGAGPGPRAERGPGRHREGVPGRPRRHPPLRGPHPSQRGGRGDHRQHVPAGHRPRHAHGHGLHGRGDGPGRAAAAPGARPTRRTRRR